MSNQFLCDLLALFLKQGFLVKLGKFLAVHSLRPVFVYFTLCFVYFTLSSCIISTLCES